MIAAVGGVVVGGFELVPAGESSSEHKDGGFRCMKIGDKAIDDLEIEAWINKNVVFALSFASFGPIFEGTSDGGADRDNAVAGSFSSLNGGDGFGGNMKPFGMHVVVFDIVAANGKESAKANMECKVANLNTFGLELLNERLGHVEAGGWCGGGTKFFGPDGLITLDIVGVGVAVEIGRQRNVTIIGNDSGEVAAGSNSSGAIAKNFFDSNNVGGNRMVGDVLNGELVADVKLAAIHNVINFASMLFEYDKFAWTTVGQLSEDTRAHDASIVQDNEVASFKKNGKIGIA